jgi:COX assembly protein 2
MIDPHPIYESSSALVVKKVKTFQFHFFCAFFSTNPLLNRRSSECSSLSFEMHPPLDRPHPDCEEQISDLKICHAESWKKYLGRCNDIKVRLDNCLKAEKKRLLDEMNVNLVEQKLKEQDVIKEAFGKSETFEEYLARDRDYQAELSKKRGREQKL